MLLLLVPVLCFYCSGVLLLPAAVWSLCAVIAVGCSRLGSCFCLLLCLIWSLVSLCPPGGIPLRLQEGGGGCRSMGGHSCWQCKCSNDAMPTSHMVAMPCKSTSNTFSLDSLANTGHSSNTISMLGQRRTWKTVGQHWNSIGWMSRVCWEGKINHLFVIECCAGSKSCIWSCQSKQHQTLKR